MENKKQALKEIEEIERLIGEFKKSEPQEVMQQNIFIALKEAQAIADKNKFKGGCEKIFKDKFWGVCYCCDFPDLKHLEHFLFCPACQEEKKICDEIQEINERIQKSS